VSVFTSPTFWLILVLVLAALIIVMVRHDRAGRRGPKQRHGVVPHEQPRLIVTDIGRDGAFNKVIDAYHVTTDPQAYADIFVPSGKKE
jgi:hypothetical protein